MATYVKYDPVIEFTSMDTFEEFSKNKQNNSYNDYRNFEDCNDYDIFFWGENNVKKGTGTPDSKELQKIKEKRLLSLDEFNDTITMSLNFINKLEHIIKYFNFFLKINASRVKLKKLKIIIFHFPNGFIAIIVIAYINYN